MMKYKIRYTPEAMRDMDAVWDGVYEASKEYDVADQYVNDGCIEVIRIIMGKMDYMKILFGEAC